MRSDDGLKRRGEGYWSAVARVLFPHSCAAILPVRGSLSRDVMDLWGLYCIRFGVLFHGPWDGSDRYGLTLTLPFGDGRLYTTSCEMNVQMTRLHQTAHNGIAQGEIAGARGA